MAVIIVYVSGAEICRLLLEAQAESFVLNERKVLQSLLQKSCRWELDACHFFGLPKPVFSEKILKALGGKLEKSNNNQEKFTIDLLREFIDMGDRVFLRELPPRLAGLGGNYLYRSTIYFAQVS